MVTEISTATIPASTSAQNITVLFFSSECFDSSIVSSVRLSQFPLAWTFPWSQDALFDCSRVFKESHRFSGRKHRKHDVLSGWIDRRCTQAYEPSSCNLVHAVY